jgi:hypothetical protein
VEGVSLPAHFLLGRSIELSLKAFLLHHGFLVDDLRKKKLGHNLRALLEQARRRGLERHIKLEAVDFGAIQLLSYDYAEKRLEYRVTAGTYYLPLPPKIWTIARKFAYELGSGWNAELRSL